MTEAFEERERLERTPSSVSWVLEQMELESGAWAVENHLELIWG